MFDMIRIFFKKLAEVRSFRDLITLILSLLFPPVIYLYGCPNSSRTTRLQLQKKLFK